MSCRAVEMNKMTQVCLDVPFVDKEEVEALGARFDYSTSTWHIPEGIDAGLFRKWMALPVERIVFPAMRDYTTSCRLGNTEIKISVASSGFMVEHTEFEMGVDVPCKDDDACPFGKDVGNYEQCVGTCPDKYVDEILTASDLRSADSLEEAEQYIKAKFSRPSRLRSPNAKNFLVPWVFE